LSLRYHVRTPPTISCPHSRLLQWSTVVSLITYSSIMRSAHWNEHDFTKQRPPLSPHQQHRPRTVAHSTEIRTNIALRVRSTSRVWLRQYVYGHQPAPPPNCVHVSSLRDDFDGGAPTLSQEPGYVGRRSPKAVMMEMGNESVAGWVDIASVLWGGL